MSAGMLHLAKLAVGVRDIAHLRDLQAARAAARPPLRHQTRSFPRRMAEITDGGSIYWVIRGAMVVRQRVLAVVEDQWDDQTRCAGLVLHPELVPVSGRPVRAFQGWRYLPAAEAPADLGASGPAVGDDGLPERLRRDLQALCLL